MSTIPTKKFNYDLDRYPFAALVTNCFGVSSLELLHQERLDMLPQEEIAFENDTETPVHKWFYDHLNASGPLSWGELVDVYERFIREVIAPIIDEEFIYQQFPSFRVQLPDSVGHGAKAVYKWHTDGDEEHRHPPGEINFQIALTQMSGTSATWVESSPGKGDHSPMNMKPGEFYQFWGHQLNHGNHDNKTGLTRVSFDFRVLPMRFYNAGYEVKSKSAGHKFVVGGYYKEL